MVLVKFPDFPVRGFPALNLGLNSTDKVPWYSSTVSNKVVPRKNPPLLGTSTFTSRTVHSGGRRSKISRLSSCQHGKAEREPLAGRSSNQISKPLIKTSNTKFTYTSIRNVLTGLNLHRKISMSRFDR